MSSSGIEAIVKSYLKQRPEAFQKIFCSNATKEDIANWMLENQVLPDEFSSVTQESISQFHAKKSEQEEAPNSSQKSLSVPVESVPSKSPSTSFVSDQRAESPQQSLCSSSDEKLPQQLAKNLPKLQVSSETVPTAVTQKTESTITPHINKNSEKPEIHSKYESIEFKGRKLKVLNYVHQTEISEVCIVQPDGHESTQILKITHKSSDPLCLEQAYKEISLHRHLKKVFQERNVTPESVSLCGFIDDDEMSDKLLLLLPHLEGRNLRGVVKEKGKLSEREAKHIAKKLVAALQFLHNNSMIHRDIKPDNILVTAAGDVFLIDYGFACILQKGSSLCEHLGSLGWLAPEVNQYQSYDTKADIFSLGCVIMYMLTGTPPFPEEFCDIAYTSFYDRRWGNISGRAVNFLRGLLEVTPDRRLTIDEAAVHPWITSYQGSEANTVFLEM